MKPWMKSALRVLLALAIIFGILWFFGNAMHVSPTKRVTGSPGPELQKYPLRPLAVGSILDSRRTT